VNKRLLGAQVRRRDLANRRRTGMFRRMRGPRDGRAYGGEDRIGVVMIKAMSCGTPVIIYPSGWVPEVVEDGITVHRGRRPSHRTDRQEDHRDRTDRPQEPSGNLGRAVEDLGLLQSGQGAK
jgi:hypothetical protein